MMPAAGMYCTAVGSICYRKKPRNLICTSVLLSKVIVSFFLLRNVRSVFPGARTYAVMAVAASGHYCWHLIIFLSQVFTVNSFKSVFCFSVLKYHYLLLRNFISLGVGREARYSLLFLDPQKQLGVRDHFPSSE